MEPSKFNRLLSKLGSDASALERIYKEYYPKVVLHVRSRFGGLLSPDDVAQEVFLALLHSPPQGEVLAPAAFLCRLAEHKAVDMLRRRHPEEPLPEILPAFSPFEETELRLDVQERLKLLDPEAQELLYLHIWEGYSLKEISDLKQLGYEAVRKKTSRAYKALKKLFRKGDE